MSFFTCCIDKILSGIESKFNDQFSKQCKKFETSLSKCRSPSTSAHDGLVGPGQHKPSKKPIKPTRKPIKPTKKSITENNSEPTTIKPSASEQAPQQAPTGQCPVLISYSAGQKLFNGQQLDPRMTVSKKHEWTRSKINPDLPGIGYREVALKGRFARTYL